MEHPSLRRVLACTLLGGCLAGCASSGIVSDIQTSTVVPQQQQRVASNGTYQLSKEEQALPCSKLNGRIQLRILHLRHLEHGDKPSVVSQSLRQGSNSIGVWRSPDTASTPNARPRDLALLEAYNNRLAELNCPTFDIKTDLANRDINHIPSPKRGR